jgi:hypothetical protein
VPHSDEHLDEVALSLIALGEPAGPAGEQHLTGCEHCDLELASLRAVVRAAREPAEVTPPARVWENIAAATGVQTMPRTLVGAAVAAPVRPKTARIPAQRRPRVRALTAALTGLALAAGVLIGVGVTRLGDDPPKQQVLAATRLGGLRFAPGASGKADVVETKSGRELDLDVTDLARPDGFYQVWLIDRSVTRMVPVGVLNGDVGRWSLPDDMDLADYPLVDVSIEPLDGNPAHSGKSVLRGTLSL